MKKVIIDCDPGIDDSLAIMLALSSKEIEVIGITIVCGNCPVDMGFENAKKLGLSLDYDGDYQNAEVFGMAFEINNNHLY